MRLSYTIQRKLTGQGWLELIPAHWQVRRIKTLFHEVDERNGGGIGELLSLTRAHGLIPQVEASNRIASVSDLSNYKVCRPGNLVMNRMQAWSGMFAVPSTTGLVSPDYCVFETIEECEVRYFEHLFKTRLLVGQFARMSKGIGSGFNRLYTPDFGSISVVCPPLTEQTAIVRYLDAADEHINCAISAKERLIELLTEQRQATIHSAVTRGLDPNVPLKDSGVEWLGDVPEYWQVASLRHRYAQSLGKMLDSKRYTGIHSLPYIRNIDVQWDCISVENLPVIDISPDEYDRYTLQFGDLLVCEGGEVGRCAIWMDELPLCGFQKALHRLRPLNRQLDVPRFMYFVLNAAAHSRAFDDGQLSTISHLTGEKLRAHRFPFPPHGEQAAIACYLDKATADIDTDIDKAQRQIVLLREYRTRLIADVVTGQVDVRGAVGDEAELPVL